MIRFQPSAILKRASLIILVALVILAIQQLITCKEAQTWVFQ